MAVSLIIFAAIIGVGATLFLLLRIPPEQQAAQSVAKLSAIRNVEVRGKITATGMQKNYLPLPDSLITAIKFSEPLSALFATYDTPTTDPISVTYSTDFQSTLDVSASDHISAQTKFNLSASSAADLADVSISGSDLVRDGANYLTVDALHLRAFDASKQEQALAYLSKPIKLDAAALVDRVGKQYVFSTDFTRETAQKITATSVSPTQLAGALATLAQSGAVQVHGTFQDRLLTINVNGTETHHYQLTIDPKKLATALPSGQINTFFAQATSASGEIWIGAADGLPHRLSLTATMPESSGFAGTITALLSFDSYNKSDPAIAQAPSDAIAGTTISDAVLPLLFPKFIPLPIDTNADTDGDGLTDTDEAKYGTSATNPDTDGDGYKDGDEVRNGYNPNGAGKL